jgi:hypothetical protein
LSFLEEEEDGSGAAMLVLCSLSAMTTIAPVAEIVLSQETGSIA